ncbi:hypothetical protein [Sphingomicrobium astaxanthinifaciens]|uniref:hypothetical protein n=1 Tax=Sphingomicrobium astaxanthinifaciens TaxID=1227949 RepID=UPI001FCC7DCD|nr:hypothetical protein [Sphingomicrobium astaxanthinifaciens]MCJ7420488.1 hypothetical protein [Sphingomicrobium astaxanthinifaciens]
MNMERNAMSARAGATGGASSSASDSAGDKAGERQRGAKDGGDSQDDSSDNSQEQEAVDRPPTWLGWVSRIVSLGFLLILSGLIVWKMITSDSEVTFRTEVETDKIRQEGSQWLIPVDISNEGGYTAHKVQLDVTVGATTTPVEIEMIGAKETVRFFISADAPVATATHEVKSYEHP